MKNFVLVFIPAIAFLACNPPTLDKNLAAKLIEEKHIYPNVVSLNLQQNDGERTAQLRLTDLQKQGIVDIVPADAAVHIDSPFFRLTDRGKHFQLSPAGDQPPNILKVKLATANIKPGSDALSVQTGKSGNVAVVDFPVVYSDLSPFAVISTIDFDKEHLQRIYFTRKGGNWEIVDRPGAEFDEFNP